MRLFGCKRTSKSVSILQRWLIGTVVFAIGLALVVFSGRELWTGMRDDAAAQSEYAYLRELSSAVLTAIVPPQMQHSQQLQAPTVALPEDESNVITVGESGDFDSPDDVLEEPVYLPPPPEPPESLPEPPPASPPDPIDILAMLDSLSEINPDFVGWIIIPGTTVNYPIVRGRDNSRYLYTTFKGERNPAGAIFMDYRCTGGFDAPASLIHGHNMRGGTMFAPLMNYLNREFMENYPNIIILTANGETLVYRIFRARFTDAWDGVFTVNYADAEATAAYFGIDTDERLLIMSTCAGGADRDVRLLVYATLIGGL
jgi:sortase B